MADYRFAAQAISRSAGRTAVAAAAYRAGAVLSDERTGLAHDYSRKSGVMHTEIMAPDDAPEWVYDRSALWNQVEKSETRVNSQLSREVQLSLPHELNHEERVALVRDFVQENFVAKGMVADVAIHAPSRDGDQRNFHAHVMLTTRAIGPDGFAEKRRDWNSKETLQVWREQWAVKQNAHLRRSLGERAPQVSHKSYLERGIQKTPGHHLGPAATALERQRAASRRGDLNRIVHESNERAAQIRSHQDKLIQQLPKEEKTIGQVAFELGRLKEQLVEERAQRANELSGVLQDMRGKRGKSMRLIEKATLEPFEEKEREARQELAIAQQRAEIQATPKEIMRWFTNPAAALWGAAKKSMAADAAAQRMSAIQTNKADFKAWLNTEEGKAFTRQQLAGLTKNSPEIEAAVRNVKATERATERAKVWLKSETGVQQKISKVRELQGDLTELRTRERKARRNIAQLDRAISVATRTEKLAKGLAETQLAQTIKTPVRNPDTPRYIKNIQGTLNDIARRLTPTQQQTLTRFLTRGLGLSRG